MSHFESYPRSEEQAELEAASYGLWLETWSMLTEQDGISTVRLLPVLSNSMPPRPYTILSTGAHARHPLALIGKLDLSGIQLESARLIIRPAQPHHMHFSTNAYGRSTQTAPNLREIELAEITELRQQLQAAEPFWDVDASLLLADQLSADGYRYLP